MDFSNVWPTAAHPFLKWLGKQEGWLQVYAATNQEGRPCSAFRADIDKLVEVDGYDKYKKEVQYFLTSKKGRLQFWYLWIDALAACIANGAKTFEPNDEQWISLQEVEIHLPISDYHQPYPSMIVRIPTKNRASMAQCVGIQTKNAPTWLVVRTGKTVDNKTYVFTGQTFEGGLFDNSYFFQDREGNGTIEDCLNRFIHKPDDTDLATFAFSKLSSRAAINSMLLLMHYGHKTSKPTNRPRRCGERTIQQLTPVLLERHVVVRKIEYKNREAGEPTGRELSTHWRRGHWRAKAGFGESRSRGEVVPLILIPPVLVRADKAGGEVETVYSS